LDSLYSTERKEREMTEDLGTTIRDGFETWKKNLSICLPFVFSWILTSIVVLVILGVAVLATLPALVSNLDALDELPPELIFQQLPLLFQNLGIILIAVAIAILVSMVIDAFFWAGAIGMAKEAIETGHTDLSQMIDYGKRKYVSIFVTNIIIGLLSLVGLVFLIPSILAILPKLSRLSALPESEVVTLIALFGVGFLAFILYTIIISILFALPRYVVVINDVGAVDGIKTGFTCFLRNKLAVFLLWLVIVAVNILATALGALPYIGGIVMLVLLLVVVLPLTVIWWSRLYLSIVETPGLEAGAGSDTEAETE
jgi:hypothetical protein